MKFLCTFLLSFTLLTIQAQTFNVWVHADSVIGEIRPLWNDYWELNVQHGYGPHTWLFPNTPHTPFLEDPGFVDAMDFLQPRSIKISIGTFIYLPHVDYASTDTNILKSLPTEFYRGGNSMVEADDPNNYYFDYLDQQLSALDSIGAEPFLNIDYMPFSLASKQIPIYHSGFPIPFYQLDNEIRTVPPQSNEVYARVVRNVIRHTKGLFKGSKDYGITYYEIWNEPDHPTTNFPTFWRGTEYELFDMYAAIVQEVENDTALADEVKIGCCSFAILDDNQVIFAENFLKEVNDNDTRLDFLSVHPYSADPFRSLDTAKLSIAQLGIDLYAPNAELINTEWGILAGSSQAYTNTLEHDLVNFLDVSLMLDRDVQFAHYVNLVEYETSNGNPSLGVCTNDPIEPKITAVARANMNKLMETPNRLQVGGDVNDFLIAGKNDDETKITVAIAAVKPPNGQTHTVNLQIADIPFSGSYQVRVFELSETDYDNGDYFKTIQDFTENVDDLVLTLSYEADQNSGRLYIIVLEENPVSSTSGIRMGKGAIRLFPNPVISQITLTSDPLRNLSFEQLTISDFTGKVVDQLQFRPSGKVVLDVSNLSDGLYFIQSRTNQGDIVLKFIKQ